MSNTTMLNPFLIKFYILSESPLSTSCTTTNASIINDKENTAFLNMLSGLGYTLSQPMSIMELEKYISDEINKFFERLKFAKTCDNYAIQAMDTPANCISTFKNFPTNQSQFGVGENVLNGFVYTDSYIASQQSTNDKKQLCQRLRDLQMLLTAFNEIIRGVDKPDFKKAFPDEYQTIMVKYQNNISKRAILDQKLDNIYSSESSYGNSKRMMDSTIYVSVLWTILATTFVFYIFKKM